MTGGPWLPSEAGVSARRHAPATLRNRDAILAVLRAECSAATGLLEIASGSGEHALFFAGALPQLRWHPSDTDDASLDSIAAWSAQTPTANLAACIRLDMCDPDWADAAASTIDAILCCNMVHIAPWAAAQGLFAGAGQLLPSGAPLILYGPFIETDVPTAPSNIAFDESLRARDPAWGLRDVAALDALAALASLTRTARYKMPANNLALVWRRD